MPHFLTLATDCDRRAPHPRFRRQPRQILHNGRRDCSHVPEAQSVRPGQLIGCEFMAIFLQHVRNRFTQIRGVDRIEWLDGAERWSKRLLLRTEVEKRRCDIHGGLDDRPTQRRSSYKSLHLRLANVMRHVRRVGMQDRMIDEAFDIHSDRSAYGIHRIRLFQFRKERRNEMHDLGPGESLLQRTGIRQIGDDGAMCRGNASGTVL